MKKLGVVFVLAMLSGLSAFAGTIVLEGKYQQKNVYVINPVAEAGVGFCVYEITVNGDVTSDEVNSNAFEIDLSVYGFKLGADVVITIKYKDGCEPRVLNPGALEPQPTFETTSIVISSGGLIEWETVNEQGKLPFVIQQFKWNKWVNVGEVMGKGTSTKNTYSFQTTPVSGENKFRVVQKSQEGKEKKSDTVEYMSDKDPVTFVYNKKSASLEFSSETNYELYNVYGQIIKRGFGKTADLSNLPKNEYYVSFDSATQKFTKK
ncbi:MAG: hypothetical protein KDC12_08365 [Flavobacteriales bacterium]|nr:hypothetical protein [Flavobacteriales bacterium]